MLRFSAFIMTEMSKLSPTQRTQFPPNDAALATQEPPPLENKELLKMHNKEQGIAQNA